MLHCNFQIIIGMSCSQYLVIHTSLSPCSTILWDLSFSCPLDVTYLPLSSCSIKLLTLWILTIVYVLNSRCVIYSIISLPIILPFHSMLVYDAFFPPGYSSSFDNSYYYSWKSCLAYKTKYFVQVFPLARGTWIWKVFHQDSTNIG